MEQPALEIEPTAIGGDDLGLIPTSMGVEPTALEIEPTAYGLEPAAPAEPPPAEEPVAIEEPVAEEPMAEEPVAEAEPAAAEEPLEVLDFGEALPAPVEEAADETAARASAGLPLIDVNELEPAPAAVDDAAATAAEEAAAAQSVEFLDLGEVVTTGPSVEDLEARVAASAEDWEAHRLLGEALIEAGERERGQAELEAALKGYDEADQLEEAYALIEEILRVEPNSVKHHQKRVEVAYRQNDRARLVDAYVELADALLSSDDPGKAIAVYQRVLEHDPDNPRAKSAVETLTPAAPAKKAPAAPARPAATPTVAGAGSGGGGFVDLGAYLLDEDEGPKDLRMRIEDEEPTGDEQQDFQQMLAAFKRGIEANVGEEDFQSHYDLGVAYKEMGLLDEAIAEFQKALRAADGRLKSSEALGLCFFEKGQYAVAETIMRRGLEFPAHGDADRVGLLYWLGRTLEQQEKRTDALEAYNRVFAVDINFADVNDRVQELARAGR